MPRYEFSDGKSNKFWQIELSGNSFTTTYGRIGVKVWVYKGEVMPQRAPVTAATLTADLAAITGD